MILFNTWDNVRGFPVLYANLLDYLYFKIWIFFSLVILDETAYAKVYLGTEEHPILLVNLTEMSKCIFIINSFSI